MPAPAVKAHTSSFRISLAAPLAACEGRASGTRPPRVAAPPCWAPNSRPPGGSGRRSECRTPTITRAHNRHLAREDLHQHHVLQRRAGARVLQTRQRVEGLEEEGEGGLEVVLVALRLMRSPRRHVDLAGQQVDLRLGGDVHVDGGGRHLAGGEGGLEWRRRRGRTFALVMSFRSLYTRASVMCTSIVSDLSSMRASSRSRKPHRFSALRYCLSYP